MTSGDTALSVVVDVDGAAVEAKADEAVDDEGEEGTMTEKNDLAATNGGCKNVDTGPTGPQLQFISDDNDDEDDADDVPEGVADGVEEGSGLVR